MPLNREALVALRELAGHTQTSLAREVGTSQGYINDLESGRRTCRPPMLKRLADTLRVPIASLIGPKDAIPPPPTVETKVRPRRAGGGGGFGSVEPWPDPPPKRRAAATDPTSKKGT